MWEPSIVMTLVASVVGSVAVVMAGVLPLFFISSRKINHLERQVDMLRLQVRELTAKHATLSASHAAEQAMTARLMRIIRNILDEIRDHLPGLADRIRQENPDLEIGGPNHPR